MCMINDDDNIANNNDNSNKIQLDFKIESKLVRFPLSCTYMSGLLPILFHFCTSKIAETLLQCSFTGAELSNFVERFFQELRRW